MAPTNACKNCGSTIEPSYAFCPVCGQAVADLTFGVLFSNTISNYFSVDARFFRSFIPLMFKPGVLARRFVDGKRLSYLHPAQFYLFISVVFFFLFSFSVREADSSVSQALRKNFDQRVHRDTLNLAPDSAGIDRARKALKDNQKVTRMSDKDLKEIDSLMGSNNKIPDILSDTRDSVDSLIVAGASLPDKLKAMGLKEDAGAMTRRFYTQLLKLYELRGGGLLKSFYDTIPIAMFLLMPLFAILLKIFYWRRGNFAYHMVFSFYFFTFMFTTFCAMIIANYMFSVPGWLQFIIFLSFMLYLILALRNFYRSSWLGAIVKANVIGFVYMLIILPIAFFGIVFASFMLY